MYYNTLLLHEDTENPVGLSAEQPPMQPLLQQLACPLILGSLVSDVYPTGCQALRTLSGEITINVSEHKM